MPEAQTRIVLVVDNEPAVCQVLGKMVERDGFAAPRAGGGEEAVRVFDRHRERVDTVVLDVRMPGLDGPQTLAALRERAPTLPCVFVTSGYTTYSPAQLAARGAVVLNKPVTAADLGRAIRAVTGRGTAP